MCRALQLAQLDAMCMYYSRFADYLDAEEWRDLVVASAIAAARLQSPAALLSVFRVHTVFYGPQHLALWNDNIALLTIATATLCLGAPGARRRRQRGAPSLHASDGAAVAADDAASSDDSARPAKRLRLDAAETWCVPALAPRDQHVPPPPPPPPPSTPSASTLSRPLLDAIDVCTPPTSPVGLQCHAPVSAEVLSPHAASLPAHRLPPAEAVSATLPLECVIDYVEAHPLRRAAAASCLYCAGAPQRRCAFCYPTPEAARLHAALLRYEARYVSSPWYNVDALMGEARAARRGRAATRLGAALLRAAATPRCCRGDEHHCAPETEAPCSAAAPAAPGPSKAAAVLGCPSVAAGTA